MKKRILTLALVLGLLVALVIPASVAMAQTDTVSCTVTGAQISVSVDVTDVTYGVVGLGQTQDTVVLNQGLTATNTGNVDEDFTISSSDASGTGTDYVLAAAAGADEFTHKASLDNTTWPIAMTAAGVYSATPLGTSVATTGTVEFDLQIGMPTSVTDYNEKTITVTVLATAS